MSLVGSDNSCTLLHVMPPPLHLAHRTSEVLDFVTTDKTLHAPPSLSLSKPSNVNLTELRLNDEGGDPFEASHAFDGFRQCGGRVAEIVGSMGERFALSLESSCLHLRPQTFRHCLGIPIEWV